MGFSDKVFNIILKLLSQYFFEESVRPKCIDKKSVLDYEVISERDRAKKS